MAFSFISIFIWKFRPASDLSLMP